METDPIILEDMQKLGLDPRQWRYDAKTHRYVEVEAVEAPAIPAQKPLLATKDWDPQTGAKMPGTGELLWQAANMPTFEISPRMTTEDIKNPVLRGALNFGGGVVNSFTSPIGIATAPFMAARVVSALPRTAMAVGAGLGAMSVPTAYEAGTRIADQIKAPGPMDVAETTEAGLQLALAPLMAYGGSQISKAGYAAKVKATPPKAAATVQTAPPVTPNAIELGADLSAQEAAIANRGAIDNPLVEAPLNVRAPKSAKVSEVVKDRKLQDQVYNEARKRLLVDRGIDPETFDAQRALDPALNATALEIEATLKSAGIERAPVAEGLTQPDLVLGDPTASIKAPAVATAPIVGKNLPSPEQLIPEGFAPVNTAQFVQRARGAQLSGRGALPRREQPWVGERSPTRLRLLGEEPSALAAPEIVEQPAAPVVEPTGTAKTAAQVALERAENLQRFPATAKELAAQRDAGLAPLPQIPTILRRPVRFEDPTAIIPVEQPRNVIAQPRVVDPIEPLRMSNAARRAMEAEQLNAPQHPTVEGQRVGQYPEVPMKETRALSKLQRQRALKGLQVQPKPGASTGGFVDTRGAVDALKRATEGATEIARHGLEVFKQQIPGIKQLPFRGADKLGDALDHLYTKRRELGKYANEFRAAIRDADMPAAERAQAAALADKRAKNFDASRRLDPQAAQILGEWRATLKKMREDQIASGQPVWDPVSGNVRQAGMDPYYFPEIASRQVIAEVRRLGERSKYFQDYIDKRMRDGLNRDAARLELNDYLQGFDIYGNHAGGFSATYGAVRKVEGKGLPDSWIDTNPDRALNRYSNNFARDRALYDVIEKNPDVMTMLGQTKDFYGNVIKPKSTDLVNLSGEPLVRRTLEEYFGVGSDISNPVIRGLEQVVNASIIGIPSKITDLAGVSKMVQFLPGGLAQSFGMLKHLASLERLSIAGQHAIDQGLSKPGLGIKASAHNIIKNITRHHETWGEALMESANIIQRTGTQQLELFTKTLAQGAGEYIGNLHRTLAEAGNPESIAFLKELFGDRWQNITEAQMGARIAELNQGAYDSRALPHIPQSLRPFFKLARWSIEQAYHTKKFMIDPALRGDYKPAIAGTVSGIGAAGLVNALITEATGVLNSIPTEKEIANAAESEKAKLRAYQLISLAQMMSIGGIVSTMTKGMLDEFVMKADARGFTYPLYEVAKNAAQQTIAAATAISEGEDVIDVLSAYTQKMVFGNSQTLRFLQQIALRMGAENAAGQTQLDADRRRDYRNRRMYQITQGLPVPPMQPQNADFSRVTVQKFKRTDDPEEAGRMLPDVINRAIKKSAGDPSTLKRELHNLRVLPIHSMPDPERDPQGFQAYYLWLEKTKGPAEARATVARYEKLKDANRMKQEAIPTVD